MADMAKIDEVVAHLEAHPDLHRQSVWFDVPDRLWTDDKLVKGWQCGTTACLAGHAAIIDGWRPTDPYNAETMTKDGQTGYVGEIAADLLDLDPEDASTLFNSTNDLSDIRVVVEALRSDEDAFAALEVHRERVGRW